ncbi:MAG: hypothetical protein KDJ98_15160, partial [Rhodobacteraceae bacterium]|nr:hypothetical protein [Paracoccaceae bacterium]
PPNGWGCKCWVQQLTRQQAEARGIGPSPEVTERTVMNTRTGELRRVPVGIDPGWERNPGALRQQAMERMLEDRLLAVPDAVRQVALRDIAGSWRVQRILARTAPGSAPIGVLPQPLSDALGAETRVVVISDQTAEKQVNSHAEIAPEDYRRLPGIIETGAVIRTTDRTLVFVERVPGLDARALPDRLEALPWIAAVKVTTDRRELFLTTFYASGSIRHLRRMIASATIVRE